MWKKFSLVLFIHASALTALLLPDKFKGPHTLQISGFNLHLLEILGICAILTGTALIYYWIFLYAKSNASHR